MALQLTQHFSYTLSHQIPRKQKAAMTLTCFSGLELSRQVQHGQACSFSHLFNLHSLYSYRHSLQLHEVSNLGWALGHSGKQKRLLPHGAYGAVGTQLNYSMNYVFLKITTLCQVMPSNPQGFWEKWDQRHHNQTSLMTHKATVLSVNASINVAFYLEKDLTFAFGSKRGKDSCLRVIVKWRKEGYKNLLSFAALSSGPFFSAFENRSFEACVYNLYLCPQSWKFDPMYSLFQFLSVVLLEILLHLSHLHCGLTRHLKALEIYRDV